MPSKNQQQAKKRQREESETNGVADQPTSKAGVQLNGLELHTVAVPVKPLGVAVMATRSTTAKRRDPTQQPAWVRLLWGFLPWFCNVFLPPPLAPPLNVPIQLNSLPGPVCFGADSHDAVTYSFHPWHCGSLNTLLIYWPSLCKQAAALHWNCTEAEVESAASKAEKEGFGRDPRIEYMLVKQVQLDRVRPGRRDLKYHSFRYLQNGGGQQAQHHRQVIAAILELPSSRDRSTESVTLPAKGSFDDFVRDHPEWAGGERGVFVFFRDHPKMQYNPLIQRSSSQGLHCVPVASAVLQHYLVALSNNGVAPTLDVACWVRKHAPAEMLYHWIFSPFRCTDDPPLTLAEDVLPLILAPGSTLQECSFDQVPTILREHGPLLFNEVAYASSPSVVQTGLIVGYRLDSNGKTVLLEQCFDQSQFHEVHNYYGGQLSRWGSPSSLPPNASRLSFVVTPQTAIPSEFDVSNAVYAECNIGNRCCNFPTYLFDD